MKLCDHHHTALQMALQEHQLPLEPLTTEAQFVALTTPPTTINFDPYLHALTTLIVSATQVLTWGCVGTALCPVCAVEKRHKGVCKGEGCDFHPDEWIVESVKEAKNVFVSLCGKEITH